MSTGKMDKEEKLWLILLGAMLAGKASRDAASKAILPDDVPSEYRELWQAIMSGDVKAMREFFGRWDVEMPDERILVNIIRRIQRRAMDWFCRKTLESIKHASTGILSSQLLDYLDGATNQIRAREAAIAKLADNSIEAAKN